MKIILVGIQGSGKSTQGNILSERLGVPYLSSGHIFRQMSQEKTTWGRYVKETLNGGYLIPDEKAIPIEKLTPTSPKPKLHRANPKKLFTVDSAYIGIAHSKSSVPNTGFPPNLSVSMPAGSRKMDPVNTGMPISQPISIGPQLNT